CRGHAAASLSIRAEPRQAVELAFAPSVAERQGGRELRRPAAATSRLGPLAAGVSVELPRHRLESVPGRHEEAVVRLVEPRLAADHQLLTRNVDGHADAKDPALAVAATWRLHHHVARRDAVANAIELLRAPPDVLLERRGQRHVSKGDLKGSLHGCCGLLSGRSIHALGRARRYRSVPT